MKIHIVIFYFVVVMIGIAGCGRRHVIATLKNSQEDAPSVALLASTEEANSSAAQASTTKDNQPPTVPLPAIPSYIDDEEAVSEYMLMNYWDGTDFADSRWTDYPEIMETAFSRFTALADLSPDADISRKAVRKMMNLLKERATVENYDMMTALADKYLYDPNSPLRNEELYIQVLQAVIENDSLEDIYKVAPRERLHMAMKNRVGTKAADFAYTASDGRQGTLYTLKADYVLLFFYNLGCPACREIREQLIAVLRNEPLASMSTDGRLEILALYPDADMSQWESYAGDIPAQWINAYDPGQNINEGELYDLKAIPSLYLLGRDKRVLLKDFLDPSMIVNIIAGREAQ